MFSSMRLIGMIKSKSKLFTRFTIKPFNTIRAVFSKSVNYISIVLNSTLQPIVESMEGGGLNLREFQLVLCRFSK